VPHAHAAANPTTVGYRSRMATRFWAPVLVGLGAAALLPLSRPAAAGDYLLTVANDPTAACAAQARKVRTWCEEQRKAGAVCELERSWPLASAADVVDDLGRYFAGATKEIGVLIVSFVNGHVGFCSATERAAVHAGLAAIAARENLQHETELATILRIHASQTVLDGLRKQLARPDLAAASRIRVRDLVVDVEAALSTRRNLQ
jgi:hypothetical protein